MTNKNIIPSRAELIKQTLNTRRCRENDLFREYSQNPFFWKLSDLAILYPDLFDAKKPVSQQTANKIDTMVVSAIPEFEQLTEKPVHILSVKEPYNIYDSEKNRIKIVRNGKDQHLTCVTCEYLFGQQKGTELEQAYFLYPNRTTQNLIDAAQNLKFEKIRNQISQTSNLLSAIINHAHGADKTSFGHTWSLIWKNLYHVKSMDVLRKEYNIKTSPIDYMKQQTLIFINAMLQEIVFNFSNRASYNLVDVQQHAKEKAENARAKFFQYGSTPEAQLTEKSTYSIIEKIRNDRKNFWHKNYPLSLRQR